MPKLAVHRCGLYRPEIFVVNGLAYDRASRRLAVVRAHYNDNKSPEHNLIEIWNCYHMPAICLEQTLYRASVGSVLWCKERLFAATLDGCVLEYSPHSPQPVHQMQVCVKPIWCMARNADGSELAVGTDDGSIHILALLENGFELKRILPGIIDNRIMCLHWRSVKQTFVVGSLDYIYVYDCNTNSCVRRIEMGRAQGAQKLATIVWCLAVTPQFTIVSGDSRGRVCFWDGNTGESINMHQVHEADVLSMCYNSKSGVTDHTSRIIAAGIDPTIHLFEPSVRKVNRGDQVLGYNQTKPKPSGRLFSWGTNAKRLLHTHDVRAMTMVDGDWLVSGGVDTYLSLSRYPPFTKMHALPFNPMRCRLVSKQNRLLLFQYSTWLEVWKLAQEKENSIPDTDGTVMQMDRKPEKWIEVVRKPNRWISCSDLSADGQYLAYSDVKRTQLFSVSSETNSLSPVPCVNESYLPPAVCLHFGPDGSLFLATAQSILRVVTDSATCKVHKQNSIVVVGCVRKMQTSPDGHWLAFCASNYDVTLYNIETEDCIKIPSRKAVPFDICFDVDQLGILYGDGVLCRFCCRTSKMTETDLRSIFPTEVLAPTCIDIHKDKALIINGHQLAVVDLRTTSDQWHVTDRYDHVCAAAWLDDQSALVVHVNKTQYAQRLPPAIKLKKFGTG